MKIRKLKGLLGTGLVAGLVFALIGAVFVGPAAAGETKWTINNTPDWGDSVILPAGDILDYDIGGDGDIVYAVLELESCSADRDRSAYGDLSDYGLFESEDGGVTWTDITKNVFSPLSAPGPDWEFDTLQHVAVAPDNEEWLAVAGWSEDDDQWWVAASQDGGDNFTWAGDIDAPISDNMDDPTADFVLDLEVSPEVDDIYNIAVAGVYNDVNPVMLRLKAGTWLSGSWADATLYTGWDSSVLAIVDCEFSDNFDIDDTIVCLGVDNSDGTCDKASGEPWIQSGIWESGTGSAWNNNAGFPAAAKISSDGDTMLTGAYLRSMGLALPADYDGSDPGARAIFLYINAFNTTSALVGGWVIRSDNYSLSPVCGPSGDPLLASIDVHGDADTGKLMIGEYIQWDNDVTGPHTYDTENAGDYIEASPCDGVRVWHTEELDFCCPQWDGACKDPSGMYLALVMYTPDGEKAYASTGSTMDDDYFGASGCGTALNGDYLAHGTPADESAFSVSRDDGVSFNQLSLIDTDIDVLADVAVCPDCGTIYLATIMEDDGDHCSELNGPDGWECDSVWRSYDDGDTWERVNHGDWVNNATTSCTTDDEDELLLRLPCDAIEDCCDQDPVSPSGTLYLGIKNRITGEGGPNMTTMFYTRDCGQCWNKPPATKIDIQDFCVESENVVYVLDDAGFVSKSTQYGRRWGDKVDTGITSGHSITCCCEQGFVAVGGDGCGKQKVAWSDDGGESWTLTDKLPAGADGMVHVACDPVCENIIYAAVDDDQGCTSSWRCGSTSGNGIYRCDVTDGGWDSLNALPIDYLGIMVSREGTLYAVTDQLVVSDGSTDDVSLFTDCDGKNFITPADSESGDTGYSGVARNLGPCETACCGMEDWDYLICGLNPCDDCVSEDFDREPSALRICGCLSADTNTVLYAIDTDYYEIDPTETPDGALWYYEDCAAKHGPDLTAPADGAVLDCEACAGCGAAPFTLKWERMCNACSYDINIMDDAGNLIVEWVDKTITGDPPKLYVDSSDGSG